MPSINFSSPKIRDKCFSRDFPDRALRRCKIVCARLRKSSSVSKPSWTRGSQDAFSMLRNSSYSHVRRLSRRSSGFRLAKCGRNWSDFSRMSFGDGKSLSQPSGIPEGVKPHPPDGPGAFKGGKTNPDPGSITPNLSSMRSVSSSATQTQTLHQRAPSSPPNANAATAPVSSGSSNGELEPPHPVMRASLRVPPWSLLLYQIAVTVDECRCETISVSMCTRGLPWFGRFSSGIIANRVSRGTYGPA